MKNQKKLIYPKIQKKDELIVNNRGSNIFKFNPKIKGLNINFSNNTDNTEDDDIIISKNIKDDIINKE